MKGAGAELSVWFVCSFSQRVATALNTGERVKSSTTALYPPGLARKSLKYTCWQTSNNCRVYSVIYHPSLLPHFFSASFCPWRPQELCPYVFYLLTASAQLWFNPEQDEQMNLGLLFFNYGDFGGFLQVLFVWRLGRAGERGRWKRVSQDVSLKDGSFLSLLITQLWPFNSCSFSICILWAFPCWQWYNLWYVLPPFPFCLHLIWFLSAFFVVCFGVFLWTCRELFLSFTKF